LQPLLLVWLSVYANRPQSVTEPEAVGVPGWQTGAKALCLYSQSPQSCKPIHRALTWLKTALVEWNALHTILGPGAIRGIVSVTMPLLSTPEWGLLRKTHRYINKGQNRSRLRSRLFVRERVELLIELSGR